MKRILLETSPLPEVHEIVHKTDYYLESKDVFILVRKNGFKKNVSKLASNNVFNRELKYNDLPSIISIFNQEPILKTD